jgi:hypothetical protein
MARINIISRFSANTCTCINIFLVYLDCIFCIVIEANMSECQDCNEAKKECLNKAYKEPCEEHPPFCPEMKCVKLYNSQFWYTTDDNCLVLNTIPSLKGAHWMPTYLISWLANNAERIVQEIPQEKHANPDMSLDQMIEHLQVLPSFGDGKIIRNVDEIVQTMFSCGLDLLAQTDIKISKRIKKLRKKGLLP